MRALACVLLVTSLRGDELTQKMVARVSEEAEAFRKIAPEVLGKETLHQRAMKPAGRFHPRIGAAATVPPPAQWKERDIVSEYGFAALGEAPDAIHELRQVVSVDGKKVDDAKKAESALAKVITASDDARKKEVLKQFEKYGLVGAATDFGQLILLFTRREMERYEFTAAGSKMIGYDKALIFHYKQLDGPEALTLIEGNKKDQTRKLHIEGEIRVNAENFVPIQITLVARQSDDKIELREEAAVDYKMSPYGALLPTQTEHRELRGGKVVTENRFSYSDFHKFGASSDIKFEVEK